MQVIYIDTLFFINLVINYLILLCTAKVCGTAVSRWRIAAGGALGGAYAVACVFDGLQFLALPVIKIAFGAGIVLSVFGGKKRIFKIIVVFFAISAAFGGAVLAVSLIGGGGITESGFFMPVTMKILFLSFGVSYAAVTIAFSKAAKKHGRDIADIEVSLGGREVKLKALLDTGNTLTEPMTGRAVMVADIDAVAGLFGRKAAGLLQKANVSEAVEILEKLVITEEGVKFMLVPYSTVGTGRGVLLAFVPDKICKNGKPLSRMLVALSPNPVSDGGAYSALIGVEI